MDRSNIPTNHQNLLVGRSRSEVWENFRGRDINRWSFRNIDKFASHQVIKPSNTPHRLESLDISYQELLFPDKNNEVSSTLQYLCIDAIVVLYKGSILYEAYFEGMQPNETHLLFSVSKLFAGGLIYKLIGLDLIHSEFDCISEYLPDLHNPLFSRLSIRNLLDMQSGIDIEHLNQTDYLDRACGFAPPMKNENIHEALEKILSLKFEPGQKFEYQTINSDILSLLMTAITGKSAAELIEEYLFEPMGAEFHAFMICDPAGISELGGGLAITARDLARFGLLISNDGYMNNQQIIPCGFLKTIMSTHEPDKWMNGWLSNLTPQAKAYRYHTYVASDDFAEGAVFGVGNYGNMLFIDPEYETIITILATYPTGIDIQRFNTLMDLIKSISLFVKLNMD